MATWYTASTYCPLQHLKTATCFTVLFVFFFPLFLSSQHIFLEEDFDNLNNWDDLSLAVTWGGHSSPTSAFQMTGGEGGGDSAVLPTEEAKSYSGYGSSDDLKTFICLDYQFPYTINHSTYGVTIDFRARWIGGSSSNEGSRFVVFLTHDYPPNGLDLDLDDKYNDFDDEWWARPAYNIRIRGANTSALMMYGGGTDEQGEFEIYGGQWWLPGFSSAPGGGSPGTPSAKGWVESSRSLYSTTWRDYRYVLTPSKQELWWDKDNNGNLVKAVEQDITSDPNNSNYFYFFEHIDGVRLFWRGSSGKTQAEVTYLKISTDQDPPIAVQLNSFQAHAHGETVCVEWQTVSEINHAGFNLYRSASRNGNYVKINETLVRAASGVGQQTYHATDTPPEKGRWYYKLQAVDLDGQHQWFGPVSADVEAGVESPSAVVRNFALSNVPNPFNPTTTIRYSLSGTTPVRLDLFDVHGAHINTLVSEVQSAGQHRVLWDARDAAGRIVPSGMYLYRLSTDSWSVTQRMLYLK